MSKSFSENLKFYRMISGHTRQSISEALNISISTYSLFEDGESEPDNEILVRIAKLLQISLDELLAESTEYGKLPQYNLVRDPAVPYNAKRKYDSKRSYTVEDFFDYDGDERVELICGQFVEMCYPSIKHQRILAKLMFEFQKHIEKNKGKCEVFSSPTGVILSDEDNIVLLPDIVVACNPDNISERGIEGAPELVVEILSPSTRQHDLRLKLKLYMEYGVDYYLILDPEKEKVLFYDFKDGENTMICGFENIFIIPLFSNLSLCINTLLNAHL